MSSASLGSTARRDEAWDFRDADTKQLTHGFHAYSAMMIPQIARELIRRYGVEGGWLLDPYCGTGTSLVEASTAGMHAVGCDINPLARPIAAAKTRAIPNSRLQSALEPLVHALSKRRSSDDFRDCPIPEFPNRDFWFSRPAAQSLALLRREIAAVDDPEVRDFLWVAFSEAARDCSYIRNGEFKLYRMEPTQREALEPDVFGAFLDKLERNRRGLESFGDRRRDVEVHVCASDASQGECPVVAPPNGFGLVVTLPPYGDSATTVAYGQFSRLSAEWIGLDNPRSVDRRSMGGRHRECRADLGPVAEVVERIASVDARRANQVTAYYIDLAQSIQTVVSVLAVHATVCYVVGNRRVKGITLPTDAFVADAFARRGFSHRQTIIRAIPSKRMPSENSPSNVRGAKDTTMTREYIVVCQR